MAKQTSQDRRRRAAQVQAQLRAAERRRSLLIIGASVLVAAVIVAAVIYAVTGSDDGPEANEHGTAEASGGAQLSGVEDFPGLSRNHVEGSVDYPQNPPVGGDHAPVWVNCGTYSEPVITEMAVHALEHGAVWIAYRPDLPSGDVEELNALAENNGYVLVSPVEGMDAPVVATAWGKQLSLQQAGDERLPAFVTAYANGPQTPEPGAPCTGGASGMG